MLRIRLTLDRFRLVREEASSAGIRRITAVSGPAACAYDAEREAVATACAKALGIADFDATTQRDAVGEFARMFKVSAEEVPARVEQLVAERNALASELGEKCSALSGSLVAAVTDVQDAIKRLRKAVDGKRAEAALANVDAAIDAAEDIAGVQLVTTPGWRGR